MTIISRATGLAVRRNQQATRMRLLSRLRSGKQSDASSKIRSQRDLERAVMLTVRTGNLQDTLQLTGQLPQVVQKNERDKNWVTALNSPITTNFEGELEPSADPPFKPSEIRLAQNHWLGESNRKAGNILANAADGTGRTLGHYAAKYNQLKLLIQWLDHGGDINVADEMGLTPLHQAAALGYEKLVELLLSKEALLLPDNKARTAFHLAAEVGHVGTLQLLAKYYPEGIQLSSKMGTPLDVAIRCGQEEAEEFLRRAAKNLPQQSIEPRKLELNA